MSSITNTNQNSSVVNVGRTTPVTPGAQTAERSIPVVMATDQTSIPVVEQNKVQSEVALSLLGIPRAEIALGIFADVNTYDVNPSEWSMKPEYHIKGGLNKQANGIRHLPTEAGALVEAGRNKVSVLTSKRFFRYQPGRVSAATFGVKSSISETDFAQNPTIRKFGIYDKYDGYYWESRNSGEGDNFSVVRRTQSLQYCPVSPYGVAGTTALRGEDQVEPNITRIDTDQLDDYRIVGMGAEEKVETTGLFEVDSKYLAENKFALIDAALATAISNYPTTPAGSISIELGDGSTSGFTSATMAVGDFSTDSDDRTRFYTDLHTASVKAVGWKGDGSPYVGESSTPAQQIIDNVNAMESKCKRDLEYWIDNFILDLEYGGDAHTNWNTTNFFLGNSSVGTGAWTSPSRDIGVFPQISIFEAPIHAALRADLVAGTTLTELGGDAQTKLVTLQTVVAEAFGEAGDPADTNYTNDFVVPSLIDSAVDYGTKSKLDTFFDVKRNFWSYYVTVKKEARSITGVNPLINGKKYTIIAMGTSSDLQGDWTQYSEDSVGDGFFVGRVFTANGTTQVLGHNNAQVCETIVYSAPSNGTSSGNENGGALFPFRGLSSAQMQQVIKDKCQRDVGYVIDGYKNDTIGGGDAETTYNMSMFVRGTGLSVYSQQDANGDLSEPLRHQHLKNLLATEFAAFNAVSTSEDVSDKISHLNSLATRVVSNFQKENVKTLVTGKRAFPGNLVTLRDGLIHTHAAIYDPSLLKDPGQIKAVIQEDGDSLGSSLALTKFKLTSGSVTFGQHIRVSWSGTTGDDGAVIQQGSGGAYGAHYIKNGEVLRVQQVLGPKGNVFTAVKLLFNDDSNPSRRPVTIAQSQIDGTGSGDLQNDNLGNVYFELSVPFLFPEDYDIQSHTEGGTNIFRSEIATTTDTLTNDASTDDLVNQRLFRQFTQNQTTNAVPRGAMFPYMYAYDDDLAPVDGSGIGERYAGFINTATDPRGPIGTGNNVNVIRSQIDNINFYPEYVNWIKNNVKPEYWGVYEYRVPRSRFSHDALDGNGELAVAKSGYLSSGNRNRVYSDIATSPIDGTVARPGQIYSEVLGTKEVQSSLYNYDFTKVTMLKIEFSWYGAVGALFLAYVPVGNGEARWVRVHHLRASNQLKIASLGNATLPITYTTYGGGDSISKGDQEDKLNEIESTGVYEGIDKGYSSSSHHIVKYGASYYIDGGDRGTVRLYSHNNDSPVTCIGKQFGDVFDTVTNTTTQTLDIGGEGSVTPYIEIDSNEIPATFFVGATVRTGSSLDQNIKVIWADDSNNRLFLSSPLNVATSIKLLPDRAETVYGIETKKAIRSTREGNLVRNRVQVYPTKMSTANLDTGTARLRFKKTPIFQTLVKPNGTFTLNSSYAVSSDSLALPIDNAASGDYLKNGESTYGWFRGRIGTEGVTVFGRLYKETENYYFELLGSFEGELTLFNTGTFLPDARFQADGRYAGNVLPNDTNGVANSWTANTKSSIEKEGLSSVLITSDTVVPIPDTGVNVATTYLKEGTEQFDLATYFDYNKEYLSFPLTDIADSLYLAVDRDASNTTVNQISLGVTWEEQ